MQPVFAKKVRSVQGATNRQEGTLSVSPRRQPAPFVASMSTSVTSSSSKVTSSSLVGEPNATPTRLKGIRSLAVAAPADSATKLTLVKTSPRRIPKDECDTNTSSSARITEDARVKGMRALLFDQFDADVVQPQFPLPLVPQTRFSARNDVDTTRTVHGEKHTPFHATSEQRFAEPRVCHLGSLVAHDDKLRAKRIDDAHADSNRRANAEMDKKRIEHDQRIEKKETDRITAKSLLQQKYNASRDQ